MWEFVSGLLKDPEAREERVSALERDRDALLEAWVSMECFLDRVLQLGTDHLAIGRMVRFHVRDELYENGPIDVAKLQPLGRLAGYYTKVET